MSSKTLLQKAKSVKSGRSTRVVVTKEMEETALAWVRDEVTITQIARAMGLDNTPTRVYPTLALSLKHYISKTK